MKAITDINPTPSEAFKLRNPGLFGKTERFNPQGPALPTASNARTRLDACNKTETLFYHYLQGLAFRRPGNRHHRSACQSFLS